MYIYKCIYIYIYIYIYQNVGVALNAYLQNKEKSKALNKRQHEWGSLYGRFDYFLMASSAKNTKN